LLVFAQGEAAGKDPGLWVFLFPLALIFALYFFMDAPRRKEQARRDAMLKNMKKNDRVVTIGGIFGSVVNISADGKEVTLKVDDSTRIKFRRSAIAEVMGDETPETASKPS
jgi:preprotein translocase subunit YajC